VAYVVEARPGIAAARNRALAEAADRDLLIFIDDDERPQPGWLAALLGTYRETGSAAVAGAVISEFSGRLDPWIEAGRFFDRVRHPTGTPIMVAATNNLLLDLNQTRRFGLEFDERFGASGGSDTLFTRGIVARGASITWCDEAVVVDHVPAARMTRRWVLQRALRSGNSWSRTTLELVPNWRAALVARVRLTGRGLSRIAAGFGQFVAGTLGRRTYHQARGLRTIARGAGMVSGAYGHVYVEYRRPPAQP
jgi:succinoglycan biosynthesis protein ExoM